MARLYLSQNVFASIVAVKPSHFSANRTTIAVIVLVSAWMLWEAVHTPLYKRHRQWSSYDWKWRLFVPTLWFGWLGLTLANGADMAFAGFLFLWAALCFGCLGSALFRHSPRLILAAERLGWTSLSFSLVISVIGVVISFSIPREKIPEHRSAILAVLLFWEILSTTFVAITAQKLYLYWIGKSYSSFDESGTSSDPSIVVSRTSQKIFDGFMSRDPSYNWVLIVGIILIMLLVIYTSLHRTKIATDVPVHLPSGALATSEAKNHIGENPTVCGIAVTSHYGGGGRTLVHLDNDLPHDVFTISIRSEDWASFSPAPRAWKAAYEIYECWQ